MTALPGWPAVSGAATFQHIRRALAGTIARDTSANLRKGILPYTTAPLVIGTATMNVTVGAFVAVLDRNGAVFLANDGTVNVLLSSAPVSGSRWSVVYVKQRETEAPFSDGVAGPIIDKVESTTSEAAARALLPAGALELAVVQVNAGSANTNAAGVTITQTHPYTAAAGGTVLLRNQAEQSAWNPADGSSAFRLDTGLPVERIGGAWVGGAATLTPNAGITITYRLHRIGKLVVLDLAGSKGADMVASEILTTIPAEFRPVNQINGGLHLGGGFGFIGSWGSIMPNGEIRANSPGAAGVRNVFFNLTWVKDS